VRHVCAGRVIVGQRQAGRRDRERAYLASLLTQRDPAKEVRAFGLAGFLRARHDRLYDERIGEMRRISARQLREMAAADLASATTIAVAVGSSCGWR
jgi:ATP-binding cassette subfamily B protein